MDADDGRRGSADDVATAAADIPEHFTPEFTEECVQCVPEWLPYD